jgi:DNA primase
VTAQEMIDTGLVASRDDDPLTYDRFRNRVMFPITDFRGRIVAFGGRALSPDVPAKYLNSPETTLFQKRLVLYNGKDARTAARDGKAVVVVEGYLDVISSVMAGFEGTVAPMGTALTEDHLQLLWRMSDTPILCFDGDAAGQRAAERAAGLVLPLLQPGRTVRIARLPEGVDPDDLIKAQGRDAFADVLERARSLSDVIWSLETGGIVPEQPEARAALEQRLRERVSSIGDAAVRRHYGQAFDEKLAEFFRPVRPQHYDNNNRRDGRYDNRRDGRTGTYGQLRGTPRLVVSDTLRNSRLLKPGKGLEATPREAAILMTLVNHPELAEARLEPLAGLELSSPMTRKLFSAMLDIVMAEHDITAVDFRNALGARGFGEDISRMEQLLARQGVWQSGAEIDSIDAETGLRPALALHYKSVQLNRELKAAEAALGEDPSEETFERLRDIKNQITTVDGTEALIEGFGSLSGRATRSF